ncbi:MAG: uracil-DNA glycosylase [Pseudomonadota bacterium]|nr:uracil-DNA glycosylase [Pseudomonadota bacterium]MEC9285285.1 uracil-DNA glycosylase [Pseudomonadota bacterium]
MGHRDRVVLESSWKAALAKEFEAAYVVRLRAFLVNEKRGRKTVYPTGPEIFKALDSCPLPDTRVVIIGQDPYHGPSQAHGLCFSVPQGVAPPPSLVNIFQEIEEDMCDENVPGVSSNSKIAPGKGCLEPWARQGVLLLNSVLTVVQGRAGSHQGMGWETFTDRVVEVINRDREHVVFMLWGSYAQRKGAMVDREKHCVLSAPHPSPLSAHRGFFGCRHFSKANQYLAAHGRSPVDWFDVE